MALMSQPAQPEGLKSALGASQVNQVIHGDCLEVLRALPDACVDAIVTDPPYSSGGQFRGGRMNDVRSKYVQSGTRLTRPEFGGDNRDQRAYGYWCALWLSECLRIAKPGAPILMFTDWRQLPTTTDALQAGGWVWRGIAVWDKTEAARPAYGRYRNQAEYIVWGSNGPMRHNDGSPCLPGVYRETIKRADKHHMTGKPTHLMQELLRIVVPGGIVLDPFAGSGTTCVAAKLLGLGYIGIEREQNYVAIAQARMDALTLDTPNCQEGLGSAIALAQPKPVRSAATPRRSRKSKAAQPTPLWQEMRP